MCVFFTLICQKFGWGNRGRKFEPCRWTKIGGSSEPPIYFVSLRFFVGARVFCNVMGLVMHSTYRWQARRNANICNRMCKALCNIKQ